LAAEIHFSSPRSSLPFTKLDFGQLAFSGFFALTFAQRARCAAAIFLRAAADKILLLGVLTRFRLRTFFALSFAQRARCAAAMRALAAALSLGRLLEVDGFVFSPSSALMAAFSLLRSFSSLSRSDFSVCNTFMSFSALQFNQLDGV
jgi:hypothetical protein